MTKNSRGVAPVIIVIALALIGTLGYIAFRSKTLPPLSSPNAPTPTSQDSIVGWKTYRNNDFGFELKYPPHLSTSVQDDDTYLLFIWFTPSIDESLKDRFSVTVNENSLDEEAEFQKQEVEGHVLTNLIEQSEINFHGYKGLRLDYEPSVDNLVPTSTLIINNGIYSYTIVSETDDIDQILSTFKFLE